MPLLSLVIARTKVVLCTPQLAALYLIWIYDAQLMVRNISDILAWSYSDLLKFSIIQSLSKPEVMKTFLATQFQFEMPKIARLMAILRHEQWRGLVLKFCATKYGGESFAWHTMSDIVTAKLDEVSTAAG